MSVTLLRALVALVPTGMLLIGAVLVFRSVRTARSFVQLFGAACLVTVVLTHAFEALRLFPWMQWGRPDSPGHYLDLSSAVLGVALFPVGYLLDALARRRIR